MSRSRTPAQTAMYFVRYHLGKGAFAPLTGTDWRAWNAFVHLLELYGVTRAKRAIDALIACYACTIRGYGEQSNVADVFRQTIPAMLDWSDVAVLWPQISVGGNRWTQTAFDRDEYKAALRRERARTRGIAVPGSEGPRP